jgi:hypothetical protein
MAFWLNPMTISRLRRSPATAPDWGRLNSHVMKGHLEDWTALLIEVAAIFANHQYSEAYFQ